MHEFKKNKKGINMTLNEDKIKVVKKKKSKIKK